MTDGPTLRDAPEWVQNQLAEQPPSVTLVWLMLDAYAPCSKEEIVDHTLLDPRTAEWALQRLREQGLIHEGHSVVDARRPVYRPRERAPEA